MATIWMRCPSHTAITLSLTSTSRSAPRVVGRILSVTPPYERPVEVSDKSSPSVFTVPIRVSPTPTQTPTAGSRRCVCGTGDKPPNSSLHPRCFRLATFGLFREHPEICAEQKLPCRRTVRTRRTPDSTGVSPTVPTPTHDEFRTISRVSANASVTGFV